MNQTTIKAADQSQSSERRFLRAMHVAVLTASALLGGLVSTAGAQQPQQPPQLTKKAVQDAYMAHFKEEGYKAEIDKDGDIKIKIDGKAYYIYLTGDLRFFRMNVGVYVDSEDHDLLCRAVNAASYSSHSKVVVKGKSLIYSANTYLGKPEDINIVFPKLVTNLQALQTQFAVAFAAETAAVAAAKKKADEQKKTAEAKKPEAPTKVAEQKKTAEEKKSEQPKKPAVPSSKEKTVADAKK